MGRIELKNNPSFKPLTLANFRELFAFLSFFRVEWRKFAVILAWLQPEHEFSG